MSKAVVRATSKVFIDNVLYLPGEVIGEVDLSQLGVKSLGDKTPGLEKAAAGDEKIEQVPVAPVAPHAPFATEPQGLPPGSQISGTGRILAPSGQDEDAAAREMVAPEAPAKAKGK